MTRAAPIALAVALAACGGYAELPLPEREDATLVLEHLDLHAGAVGTVQVRVDPGADVEGPLYVVGAPIAAGSGVELVNWAHGPCAAAPTSATPASATGLRLCLAVSTTAGLDPAGGQLGLVVDARAEGRRFNAIAEVPE